MAEKNDPLLKKESKGIFSLYINRKDVGEQMLKSFMNLEINKNPDGFIFKDGDKIGILSQCYGILTLAEYSKFDIDLGINPDIAQKINTAFNDVLKRIHVNNGELVFGATPYVNNEEDVKIYIETVAVLLRVLIEVRRLLAVDLENGRNTIEVSPEFFDKKPPEDIDEDEMTELEIAFVESLTKKCLDVLVDSALTINGGAGIDYCLKGSNEPLYDVNNENMKYKGWTFTKVDKELHDKTEPSLFYTYLVADTYLALFENFENSIALLRQLRRKIRDFKKDPSKNVPDGESVESANPEFYQMDLTGLGERELRDFMFMKAMYGSFNKFNKVMLDAGHYVDSKFALIDTTKDFFSYNFNLVTAQSIEESSSSDALFNVLYAINIMMAAGVDLDYKAYDREQDFYDSMQYTIPNVQRLYKKLTRMGKDYVCNQYMLKFNEAIPNENAESPESVAYQARLLRKPHVIAYNIMPIIIKTYNVLSKFLTPYPQYEMRIYKDSILSSRIEGTWLWDKDDYGLVNNFNYVFALRNFYDYYEKYERPYAMDRMKYIEEKNQEKAQLEADHTRKMQVRNMESKREMEELKKKYEEEIEALKKQNESIIQQKAPIEKEVVKIMDSAIEESLKKALNGIIAKNGRSVISGESLQEVFIRAVISYFKEQCDLCMEQFGEITSEEFYKVYKDKDHYAEKLVLQMLGTAISMEIKKM